MTQPLFRYESNPDDELGRRLIASTNIQEGRLVFVERPFIAMQTMGNMHEGALVCNYCFAFCGSPKQALGVISDPSCLQEITTKNSTSIPCGGNPYGYFPDDPHALYSCRHKCGVVYCSLECQQDDWEWGGHRELCTGTIPEPVKPTSEQKQIGDSDDDLSTAETHDGIDSEMDPLIKFKVHAMETNEIFLLVAVWLIRILKNDLPYNDDDNMNTHPYTDFQMNAWWDVKANEEATLKLTQKEKEDKTDGEDLNSAEALGKILKQLCDESHSHLSQTLKDRLPSALSSPWLSTIGMARLIGSLEQNCLGVRRKHALQREIMEDTELRHEYHEELIQCLEGARVIGNEEDDDGSSCGCGGDEDDDDDDEGDDVGANDRITLIEGKETNDAHAIEADVGATILSKEDNVGDTAVIDSDENESKDSESDYSPDRIAAILANLKPDLTNSCLYDEWDDVIRPLDGVSHYSIATKMNHSCEPNVILVYKTQGWGRDHPLVAYIVALRDISPGEELTISYITSEDSYDERQAALANYGFVCKCLKCENEKIGFAEEGETLETGTISLDEDDLFGGEEDDSGDDDGDGDDNGEEDLFGDDEDDLFGDDEDDDGQGDDERENGDGNDDKLSGEKRLSDLVERIDSILNKTNHLAIPLKCLAPASSYIVRQVSTLLQDIQSETSFEEKDRKTITNLLKQNMISVRDQDFASCRIVGPDLALYLYNQLKSNGSWKTPMHRASYWCASIAASIGYAREGSFIVSMKYLDKAIILGQDRSIIKNFFDYVEMYASQMAVGPCPIAVQCKVSDFQCPKLREGVTAIALPKQIMFPVNEVRSNDDSNSTDILTACNASESLVIRGLASSWAAVNKWRKMDALAQEFGHRLVPIEVGSMSNEMKEAVVPFRRFVAKYLSPSAQKDCWSLEDATTETNHHIAYLAQHPLLNQIPALCHDIDMNPCGVKPTNINIWMGTGGTRTPLHFDTYDNLLVQLVGAKYVRLYKKESSSRLYVSKNEGYGGQGNMSDLDCEREDFEKHPSAKDCSYTEVVLFPGDCLFIPSREWHYVRSLSTSVSVNFWF